MSIERDDIQFEELLADKRHKEVKSLLGNIASGISTKDNSEIIEAIQEQSKSMIKFSDAIKSLPAPEVEVNVDLNAIKKIGDDISKNQIQLLETLTILVEQNKIMREWKFDFSRNFNGIIESPIKAKQIK